MIVDLADGVVTYDERHAPQAAGLDLRAERRSSSSSACGGVGAPVDPTERYAAPGGACLSAFASASGAPNGALAG